MSSTLIKHNNYFDFLRVMGSFLVILSHSTNYHLHYLENKHMLFVSELSLIAFLKIFTRINVPLFFMMSGALLLNPDYKFKMSRNLPRIIWPLLFWSIIGTLIMKYTLFYDLNLRNAFIEIFVKSTYNSHFWYMYVLIGFYIVMPILKKIVANLERKDLLYLLMVWFVFYAIVPFLGRYFETFKVVAYKPEFLAGDMGFLFLGYYLHNYVNLKTKRQIILALGALLLLYLLNFTLLHWHYKGSKVAIDFIIDRKNLLIVIQSILFFLLAKACLAKPNRFFTTLANYSFVAYCAHLSILVLIENVSFTKNLLSRYKDIHLLASLLGIFVAMLIFSYLVAYLTSLLPPKIGYYLGANKRSSSKPLSKTLT